MSQLQVTGEAKIRDIQGPVVANSGVVTALDGDASQYVRGDGTLADFPTSTGGGSSVSYYLNSSVSQGTIGGVAYRELSKDPISGAGTDITISANGYIASYITDANDPALLEVPGGNFNCEFYFSVDSNAHNPYVYAELYKYDGTTFTLLGSSQSVPEYLTNGTTLSPYYFAIPVATAALTITDRLAVRIYANVDTRIVTLHTENNHLCQVVTTFSKGLTSLNNLTRQVQFLATGTSGTDFNISSSTATHTFNLPVASAANTGKLSSTDWSTFNNKQNAITLTTTGTSGAATLVGATLNIPNYTTDLSGYLPLAGGTLTGALIGTTATFSGTVSSIVTSGGTSFRVVNSVNSRAWSLVPSTNGAESDLWLYYGGTGTGTKVAFSNNGNVGINTTNPTYTLDVDGTGRFTGALTASSLIKSGGTSSQYLMADGSVSTLTNPVTGTGLNGAIPKFTTTGSTIGSSIIFDSGTQIGINTLSPSFTLDVNGTARVNGVLTLSSTISNGTYTYTLPSATGTLALTSQIPSLTGYVQGTGTTNYLPKFTGASTIGNSLIFDNGTNIGIGLTSPSYKLDVQDNGVSGIVDVASFSVTGNGGSGRGVGILLGAAGSSNSVQVARLVGYQELANPVAVAASFAIQVANASGTLTERLRITQAGNLLIGSTTDNGSRLQVTGAATLTGALSGTSATFNDIITNTSGGYRTSASQGYILRNDANNASLGGFVRRSHWAGGAALDTQIFAETGYGIFLNVNGSTTSGLTLASTGAATFSSSVTVNGNILYINGGQPETRYAENDVGALPLGLWRTVLGGDAFYVQKNTAVAGDFSTAINCLQFTNTGAATFSSSVQADGSGNGFLINQNGGAAGLATYSANTDRAQIAFKFAQNFPASNNYTRVLDIVATGDSTGGGAIRFLTSAANAAATEKLIITSGGSVGIGTSAPSNTLTIQANDTFNQDNSGQIVIRGTSNTSKVLRIGFDTTNNYGYLQAIEVGVSTRPFVLQPFGGNVLISTTTDNGQKLQVNGITKTNGISLAKTSFSSSTTMTDAFFSWSFGGAIGQTLTLYNSSGHTNMHFIKNESSISLTIAAHSGGVIMGLTSNSGSSSITLAAFKTVQIISFGGSAWYIMYQTT